MTLQELYETLKELIEDERNGTAFAKLPVKSNQFNNPPWEIQSVRVTADHVELMH